MDSKIQKVSWSDPASFDLEAIYGYIAGDNVDAAARISQGIVDLAKLLTVFPHLGHPYPEIPGLRVAVCNKYKIFYKIQEDQSVRIIRVWHGARRDPTREDLREE